MNNDPGLKQTCLNARNAQLALKYSVGEAGRKPSLVRRLSLAADRLAWDLRAGLALRIAPWWRRGLRGTRFIGVTGSCGKTTAKEFIHAVMASRFRGHSNEGSYNLHFRAALLLLRTRPWHEFVVQEVSINYPGYIDATLGLLRPQVGVVTQIGLDHRGAFRSLENIAEEKGKLVAQLPADGVAVLNADDPLVLAMRGGTRARCVTYGLAEAAEVRAGDVSAAWPDRLRFTVSYAGETLPVSTRMCGALWLPSVLAGLATGVALGIPLADAVRAVEGVEPVPGRMFPVAFPDGVTFIRDDWKSPLWSVAPTLAFMGAARAKRKIIVIGSISDYGGGGSQRRFPLVAREAAAVADLVVFVGPRSHNALKAEKWVGPDRIRAYATPREVADFFAGFLQAGDLVLLKGSHRADHLARLAHHRVSPVTCWRGECAVKEACERCPNLRASPDERGR